MARLTHPEEWATRTPRFLFRGFHASSGGGPETLVRNDTKGIVPHLFGGTKPRTLIKSWSPTAGLRELSPSDASKLIKTHLGMRLEPTAFSSWTSDYQTALLSAIEATKGDYSLFNDYPDLSRRHISILDTARLDPDNITEVLHVSALYEAKLADTDHPCDFLIYGPVEGEALSVVPLSVIACLGFNPTEVWDNFNRAKTWTKQLITDSTRRAREIAEKFRDENDKTPDVLLAVLAAELSRQRAPRVDKQVTDMFKYRWKSEEVDLMVGLLKKDIASLKLDHGGKTALFNRSTCVHHFPQLHLTMKLLEAFMDEAWKSRWALPPQGHIASYSGIYPTSRGRTKKRPSGEISKHRGGKLRRTSGARPAVKDTMGHLLIQDMTGPKIRDIEEPPRKASYFIDAEVIAEIIADALKRIARLKLAELEGDEDGHEQMST